MSIELLPIATAAATSDEFTVTDSFPTIIRTSEKETPSVDSFIVVEIKRSDDEFQPVGLLDRNHPTHVVAGKGTYRLRRPDLAEAMGADIEE